MRNRGDQPSPSRLISQAREKDLRIALTTVVAEVAGHADVKVSVEHMLRASGEPALHFHVQAGDRRTAGLLIGKRGAVADALRTLLAAICRARGEEVRVDVLVDAAVC